jgi:hypothetical protein
VHPVLDSNPCKAGWTTGRRFPLITRRPVYRTLRRIILSQVTKRPRTRLSHGAFRLSVFRVANFDGYDEAGANVWALSELPEEFSRAAAVLAQCARDGQKRTFF